ncbi:hypothetical protein Dtox_3107 [Desulfofarcimen acetoxidans DSM 771]|jgi:hypothetical protein|uniref:Lipoprotein n=1 Tax=Desulfofarcimen acetoxidans (strain ATCC 49208 / DSM 771 / KCTC 5769 / VKM B-1644 / 5575) TaxID=485916 RepID=C8W4H3_DESAS|nr:hypothetical protein [Desulfofarcimen acetoxidans]ACV63859.1 hypothetical protein Dtox_3107 [Desulfofarcimen acetoxidans DSM 771]
MKLHGLRIPVVVLSLLLGLSLFFGCQWLYQKYNYKQPLVASLSENKAVLSYEVDDKHDQLLIEVRMSTPNLMEDYKKLYTKLDAIMGKKPFILKLTDDRDSELIKAYYNSQYAIYQAISRGTYQEMAAVINKESIALGVESKVFIDRDNIYLQMKHNNHELNEIVPRNPSSSAAMAGGELFNAEGN